MRQLMRQFDGSRLSSMGARDELRMPPGTAVLVGAGPGKYEGSVSFAVLWLRVSLGHAAAAEAQKAGGGVDFTPAVVAVTAAAFSLDALFGALRPIVNPPRPNGRSKPARYAQVFELLKHGFVVSGRDQGHWQSELEWIFDLRDSSVHHAEMPRSFDRIGTTAEGDPVFGPPELQVYSADQARKAADFAREVLEHCLNNPKPSTREWAGIRRKGFSASLENLD